MLPSKFRRMVSISNTPPWRWVFGVHFKHPALALGGAGVVFILVLKAHRAADLDAFRIFFIIGLGGNFAQLFVVRLRVFNFSQTRFNLRTLLLFGIALRSQLIKLGLHFKNFLLHAVYLVLQLSGVVLAA